MSAVLEPPAAPAKQSAKQSALAALREERGGVPQALLQAVKEQQRIRRLLKSALDQGPRTVPDLAADCGLATHLVLWHLMAMRRYGDVVEAGESGRYPLYARKGGPASAATDPCCSPRGGETP
jgi:hypothetical protein